MGMCIDFCDLSVITVPGRFPLPTIKELLDELGKAQVFSKLELTSGFNQIRLSPHKTTFHTHDGHYDYPIMSFGLFNTLKTFYTTMNGIFRDFLHKIVIVFLMKFWYSTP